MRAARTTVPKNVRNGRFESRSRLQVAIWWIMQSCVRILPYGWAAELASRRNTEAGNVDQLVYGLECVEKGSEKNPHGTMPAWRAQRRGAGFQAAGQAPNVASGRERCSAPTRPHLQAVALQRRSVGGRTAVDQSSCSWVAFMLSHSE